VASAGGNAPPLTISRSFLSEALISGEHAGIFVATAVFIPAVLVALATAYALTRHVAVMPVVTAIVAVIFGALTLLLSASCR